MVFKLANIPIDFNKKKLKQIAELQDLIGLSNVYGGRAKAIKFSVSLALAVLKNQGFMYFELSEEELHLYFKTKAKVELQKKKDLARQRTLQMDKFM